MLKIFRVSLFLTNIKKQSDRVSVMVRRHTRIVSRADAHPTLPPNWLKSLASLMPKPVIIHNSTMATILTNEQVSLPLAFQRRHHWPRGTGSTQDVASCASQQSSASKCASRKSRPAHSILFAVSCPVHALRRAFSHTSSRGHGAPATCTSSCSRSYASASHVSTMKRGRSPHTHRSLAWLVLGAMERRGKGTWLTATRPAWPQYGGRSRCPTSAPILAVSGTEEATRWSQLTDLSFRGLLGGFLMNCGLAHNS